MTKCVSCRTSQEKELRNMERGLSSKCRCQRGGKCAGHGVPKAISYTLGTRHGVTIQRCNTDTHVSSRNYKGRGIKVLFESRRDFITWALTKWPKETFKGKDFDRIDNDGHYSKDNLQLVTRGVNLRHTRVSKGSLRERTEQFRSEHPEVQFTYRTIWNLFQQGKAAEGILLHWKKSAHAAAANYKVHGFTARAKRFPIDHPEVGYRWKFVCKLLRRGLDEAAILSRWENRDVRKNATPTVHARKLRVNYPELGYSEYTIVQMYGKELDDAAILARWKKNSAWPARLKRL